ncbi:MAG: glycoside hydrolase family 26 protein [Tannerellaceae bacterium]|jgi:mannan endo-1,4-beta-mannosidase|nr:glycoside hydrolase family 26 protein [Tannerellaceae bacterium]
MNKLPTLATLALLCFSIIPAAEAQPVAPADPQATPEARQLLLRLMNLQNRGIIYGHQDDLMYGTYWWYEPGRSDVKEATGDYPGVAGFELGEIETGRERSLDSVSFAQITEQVKLFHQMNGIITVSWHCINPITSQQPGLKTANGPGSAWDVPKRDAPSSNRGEVKSILPGGKNHEMFNKWLGTLAQYFLTWTDSNGRPIPFLFRPYHEHSGDFFWWGNTRCTTEEYIALWKYTVNFLRDKGLHNILYVYNTDKVYSLDEYLTGYPGDEYIDMLAIDWYGSGPEFNIAVDHALNFVSQTASAKRKPAALSECGNTSWDMINILQRYRISYFLTWRNRYMPSPIPSRFRPVNEGLNWMYHHPHTLFLRDIQ